MELLILKTNINNKRQVKTVAPLLNRQARIARWNIDLHDVDKILRIEAAELHADTVVQLITEAGFFCEELHD
ncbi:MAG TPA: hypothetical protein VL307_14840 [Chitinophagaceae bacterium]|nr:hypothetical protein [Chitinophagaceae bacterium]